MQPTLNQISTQKVLESFKHIVASKDKKQQLVDISLKAMHFNKNLNWDDSIKDVYLATSINELLEIYKLRAKVYEKMGYSKEFPPPIDGLDFDIYDTNSAILYTKKDGIINATCRVIFDSEKKLPLDKNYSLNYLRGKNKKLIELSRLMILKDSNALSLEFKYLTKGVYNVMILNNVTTLTGVMVQEHFKLYEKFGNFKQEAYIKSYGNLGKPFIVTSWENIDKPSKFFKKLFLN